MATETSGNNLSFVSRMETVLKDPTLALVIAVIGSVSMLIIPLPIVFLDFFQIFNIIAALVIMITVLNAKKVLDFATFPTILLFTTILRLAINVSATRLILTQGEAFSGKVIKGFADFVVGGNYVVGFIVFIVITAVMFIVITKGATRVSEVSARFQLDAMPQKQLAIDTELSQGLIDEMQAKEKREFIQREAAFYGNMDGASKFVSGDIKVGLIITIINILGGIITGTLLRGEDIGSAFQNYVMFSVGDGLVAQIPSLLISTASGVIVTRNISENSLGEEMRGELFSNAPGMYVVSIFVFFISFLPGFPMFVFWFASGLLAFVGYSIQLGQVRAVNKKKDVDLKEEEKKKKEEEENYYDPARMGEFLYMDPIELEIGYNLIPLVDPQSGGDLLDRIKKMRKQIVMDLGLIVPQVRLTDNMQLMPEDYEIKIFGTKVGGGKLMVGKLMALPPSTDVKVEGEKTVEPVFNLPAYWIDEDKREEVEQMGCNVFDSSTIIATHLTELIKRNAGDLITRKDVQSILDALAKRNAPLTDEIKNLKIKNGEIQKLLQLFLDEGISIRNVDILLEATCDYYNPGLSSYELYENVRYAIRRQISNKYADEDYKIHVVTFSPEIEEELAGMIRTTSNGSLLDIPLEVHQRLIDAIVKRMEKMREKEYGEILMVGRELRMPLRRLIKPSIPSVSVLADVEVAEGYGIDIVETI